MGTHRRKQTESGSELKVKLKPVRSLLFIPFFVVPALAFPQKPSDWRKTPLAPIDFAKRVDRGLYNLKGAFGEATFTAFFFDGAQGRAKLKNRIRDRKNFRVEFVRIDPKSKDPFVGQIMIANNGKLSLVTSTVGVKSLLVGRNPGFTPANLTPVRAFPEHFTQMMFEHYVTGKSGFTPFVQGLFKGDGGFSVKMESRTMQGGGMKIPQVRLFATRSAAAAKKLGAATIEIVTDTRMWLPLQIRVNLTDLKGRNARLDWQAAWSGPYRFDDKWFKTPG